MSRFLDAFWRAMAYCLHPRVIVLSLLPLFVTAALAGGLAWLYWEPAVAGVRGVLDGWFPLDTVLSWAEAAGLHGVRGYLAPLIVIALSVPAVALFALVLVALFMTPALVKLVADRRFPQLERKHGAPFWQSASWSLGCTLVALVALGLSLPLWLVPPLMLVLPPLIWGWLTYRVMSFDVLAEHASTAERRELIEAHRWPLLAMGIIAGYLGAAPSLLWALGAVWIIPLAPVLAAIAVWIYTLVFAFSALWFAHYALSALQQLRQDGVPPPAARPRPEALPPYPDAGLAALPPR